MPWRADAANAGFSCVEPWLPVDRRHFALAADAQDKDRRSTLNRTRGFIEFRKRHIALREGAIRFIDTPEPVLAFERSTANESLLCVFNLGADPVEAKLPKCGRLLDYGLAGEMRGDRAVLPPYGGIVLVGS